MKRRRDRRAASHEPAARGGVQPSAPTDEPRAASDRAAESSNSDRATESEDGAALPEGTTASSPAENRRSARAFLIAAAQVAVFVPAIFYLQSGEINAYALSFTGFLVVLCLLVALGFSVPNQPEQQTPVAGTTSGMGGLPARVGGFWLVACALGPFFGWLATAPEFALTEGDWWWRYAARAALSVGLPVLTSLPLLLYVRGKYWYVALLLLLGVTSLPVWSGANTLLDLREGPAVERATGFYDAMHNSFYPAADGKSFKLTTLVHTRRTIKIEPAPPDERRE